MRDAEREKDTKKERESKSVRKIHTHRERKEEK